MAESHSIERRAFAILKRHLEEQGRMVEPSDNHTFDLIVDGRCAELKGKGKAFDAFDFFWLSENQYNAAMTDHDFLLFLVCGVEAPNQPEVFEIPAARFRAVPPKSERHYYYDKGLTVRLLNPDEKPLTATAMNDGYVSPDLDAAIGEIIDQTREELYENWDDPERGRVMAEFAEQVAELVFSTSKDMVSGFPEAYRNLTATLEKLGVKREVRQALQVRLATEFATDTYGMMERCLRLIEIIRSAAPSDRVLPYLQRLSRTYLVGFDTECIVMCRAVLENAVNDRYRAEQCDPPANEAGRSEMRAKLAWARMVGWLDPELEEQAWRLWLRGSKAAHVAPGVVGDVLGTIKETLEVLEALSPGSQPSLAGGGG